MKKLIIASLAIAALSGCQSTSGGGRISTMSPDSFMSSIKACDVAGLVSEFGVPSNSIEVGGMTFVENVLSQTDLGSKVLTSTLVDGRITSFKVEERMALGGVYEMKSNCK